MPFSDDKNGANLFKNVLQSLRKDKKWPKLKENWENSSKLSLIELITIIFHFLSFLIDKKQISSSFFFLSWEN